MGGSVARVAPAITTPYLTELGLPVMPPKIVARPAGKVRVLSSLVTMNGHRKLFQLAINVKIITAVIAGPESGKMIRHQMPKSVAPSIRAESSRSLGMPWKNWVNKYSPKALA